MTDEIGLSKPTSGMEKDPHTLRVRGGDNPTNPVGLSRSIVHVLSQYKYVRVLSVGTKAQTTTMEAFRLADQFIASKTQGVVLVCRQSEYAAEIDGKMARGICTRIFGIPIEHAI